MCVCACVILVVVIESCEVDTSAETALRCIVKCLKSEAGAFAFPSCLLKDEGRFPDCPEADPSRCTTPGSPSYLRLMPLAKTLLWIKFCFLRRWGTCTCWCGGCIVCGVYHIRVVCVFCLPHASVFIQQFACSLCSFNLSAFRRLSFSLLSLFGVARERTRRGAFYYFYFFMYSSFIFVACVTCRGRGGAGLCFFSSLSHSEERGRRVGVRVRLVGVEWSGWWRAGWLDPQVLCLLAVRLMCVRVLF